MGTITNDTAVSAIEADTIPSSELVALRAYARCVERGVSEHDPVSDGLAAEPEVHSQMKRSARTSQGVEPNIGGGRTTAHRWAVVLAGGDGERLAEFTRDAHGRAVPKQYCSFGEPTPMVRWAIARAQRLASRDRVLVVVNEAHRRFWERELCDIPRENLLVQPSNRGTANGMLFAVLEVQARGGTAAPMLMLPSDHFVADEDALHQSLLTALDAAARSNGGSMFLLGMEPTAHDAEYGWILPATGEAVTGVRHFQEKPSAEQVRQLVSSGALINSFIIVAHAHTMVGLFSDTLPGVLQSFRGCLSQSPPTTSLPQLYERLPRADFSRDVLERSTPFLNVVRVAPCGWSDLGTPARLQHFMAQGGQAA